MSYVDPILAQLANKRMSAAKKHEYLDEHYDRMRRFIRMACTPTGKSLIVNGNAGMGKTEYTNDIVKEHANEKKVQCEKVSGTLSSVMLFEKLYRTRKKHQVLIVDDTDKILEDTESLEVLKAALDSREDKEIDWAKYSTALKSRNVQTKFAYEGKIIIITNKMLRTAPDDNPTVAQQRVLPLMSRVNYFRAGLPDNGWKVEAIKMFAKEYQSKQDKRYVYKLRCADDIVLHPSDKKHLPKNAAGKKHGQQIVLNELVKFVERNKDDLREVSFRTVAKLVELRNQEPDYWESMAMADMGI